jgi:hypothetical protein
MMGKDKRWRRLVRTLRQASLTHDVYMANHALALTLVFGGCCSYAQVSSMGRFWY